MIEGVSVAFLISGAFYLMNQEKARASGAMKKLQSSSISLFVVVAAVMLLTSFFIGGGAPTKRMTGGGETPEYAGGAPIDVALRQISMEEPYW